MERLSEGEYHLSQTMRGWYYLPFAQKPETNDWWKMDNDARERAPLLPSGNFGFLIKAAEIRPDIASLKLKTAVLRIQHIPDQKIRGWNRRRSPI